MEMPDIHTCSQLNVINERLKKRLKRMKKENVRVAKELTDIKAKLAVDNMMKQYVTTRSTHTQTDAPKSLYPGQRPAGTKKSQEDNTDVIKTNKMMSMYNSLMKRYEKELKTNTRHMETIATLNLQINTLEQKLRSSQDVADRLRAEQETARKQICRSRSRSRGLSRSRSRSISPSEAGLKQSLEKIKQERDKLLRERKKLKIELKGLDVGFFDEVEDLKFALQQSAKLNKEYEKTVKKLCKQFGVPFPQPGLLLASSRK